MTDRARRVPKGRISRLAAFGQMAGGVAAGALGEGAKRWARGERPQLSDLVLTPGNARRVSDQLGRLRGAAMKLGQMISLDAGDVLPAELTEILARLREAADVMPPKQLDRILIAEWGPDWRKRFARFESRPIAAASIGQVHRAVLPSGRELAVKVQYPGVADSIDADIDNVATLLRYSGLLPAGLDLAPLLAEAKRQLHEEADYLREAEQMRRYRALLADDPRFVLPEPIDDLLRPTILPMDFLPGRPIETLTEADQPQRDQVMSALLDLLLREVFTFGYMQTDPNFGNFRWQPDEGRIVLLDFGAARSVGPETAAAYRRLLQAVLAEDRAGLRAGLLEIGFVSEAQLSRHGAAFDKMIDILVAHIADSRAPGALFDFSDRSFVEALRATAAPIMADRSSWHLPPAHTLFVQRKISGTALLSVRMRAQVPLIDMVRPYAEAAGG
ncbi:putative unusual protein kinase regulating ubiquinone biosynthesis (AarF/ABC1/UbiB family) [Thioclava sp. ES.031]|uniref:ABC1 kinase family protein n=1 Tax=Thioclava sp. ES.031 TaxID=1798203 RepID=UPI000BF9FD66|nr:AarF/ABC1/UbiB kinase family protein [Thioclava sp. ES.031]PFG62324.1 putative unusual protein kinase regulating ubiquinone biosynthesis (AarF/ABC1/UbiB family) [Thioclava sp. ES.031]